MSFCGEKRLNKIFLTTDLNWNLNRFILNLTNLNTKLYRGDNTQLFQWGLSSL